MPGCTVTGVVNVYLPLAEANYFDRNGLHYLQCLSEGCISPFVGCFYFFPTSNLLI